MKPIRLVAIVALILGFLPMLAQAQESYFPDLVFFPDQKNLNAFQDRMMTAQLKALKEPSLWKKSQTEPKAMVYRFLWLGSYEKPACMRITRLGDVVTMRVSRHDKHPGILTEKDNPKLTVDREVKLTLKQWDDLVKRLDALKFMTAPTEVLENSGMADGDNLFIEGIKDGNYQVIERARETSKEYRAIFRTVVEAAGPDIVESYFRWHQKELKNPERD